MIAYSDLERGTHLPGASPWMPPRLGRQTARAIDACQCSLTGQCVVHVPMLVVQQTRRYAVPIYQQCRPSKLLLQCSHCKVSTPVICLSMSAGLWASLWPAT